MVHKNVIISRLWSIKKYSDIVVPKLQQCLQVHSSTWILIIRTPANLVFISHSFLLIFCVFLIYVSTARQARKFSVHDKWGQGEHGHNTHTNCLKLPLSRLLQKKRTTWEWALSGNLPGNFFHLSFCSVNCFSVWLSSLDVIFLSEVGLSSRDVVSLYLGLQLNLLSILG